MIDINGFFTKYKAKRLHMVKEGSQPLAPKQWQLTVGEHGKKKKLMTHFPNEG